MSNTNTMNILTTEPIDQFELETDPKMALLDTAISIALHREKTSGNNYSYERIQRNTLNDLYNESFRFCNDLRECQPGGLLEALFYINMKQLGVPIIPSTGEEDSKGIDFFVFDKEIPIDVTCNSNPEIITKKLRRNASTILFIPQFPKQRTIKQTSGREIILNQFLDKELQPSTYLNLLLTINADFKEILIQNLASTNTSQENLRINKVKKKDIFKLENTLHRFSCVLEQL